MISQKQTFENDGHNIKLIVSLNYLQNSYVSLLRNIEDNIKKNLKWEFTVGKNTSRPSLSSHFATMV